MTWNHRRGGSWSEMTPKRREGGQWVEIGGGSGGGGGDYQPCGYSWDKTFTDYSWLTDADANGTLNVEAVTNLNTSGAGSITEAVNNASSYPTVVVFEVGGVIDLGGDELVLDPSDGVWIAGETAPDPGISFVRGGVSFRGRDAILSHMGFYAGDETPSERDAFNTYRNDAPANVIVDHCTALWGTDECIGCGDPVDQSSFINCLIAEGLYDSIHPEGTHSCGLLFNNECVDVTVAGNLFAHHNRRHPLNRADAFIVNNYIYNWGSRCIHNDNSGPTYTSIGHYIEDGPDTNTMSDRAVHSYSASLYYDDIHTDGVDRAIVDGSITVLSDPPVVPPSVSIADDLLSATDVPAWTQSVAGQRPASRPQVDADLVNNRIGDGAGSRIDSQNEVGGYPSYSTTIRSLSVPSTGIVDWIKNNHTGVVEGRV